MLHTLRIPGPAEEEEIFRRGLEPLFEMESLGLE